MNKILKDYWEDLVFLIILNFLFLSQIDLSLIFQETNVAGGDMISHPWIFEKLYLNLKNFKLWSWDHSWFGGYPFLYFYFYPIYFIAVFFKLLGFSTAISFKLMVFSIYILSPNLYYIFTRRFFSKNLSLLFSSLASFAFFNELDSMYGGNFKSFLAGQVSHQLGILMLIGYLICLLNNFKNRTLASFLLAMTVLCHVFSGFFSILFTLVFIIINLIIKDYAKIKKVTKVIIMAMGVSIFHWGPFLYYRNFTIVPIHSHKFSLNEIFNSLQIYNPLFLLIFSAPLLILIFLKIKKIKIKFTNYGFFFTCLLFFSLTFYLNNSPILYKRLINTLYIIFSLNIILFLKSFKLRKEYIYLLPAFIFIQTSFQSTSLDKLFPNFLRQAPKETSNWWRWNFSGIEVKDKSQYVIQVWDFLKEYPDNQGRVMAEYYDYNDQGSPRIFELTPMMTGKPIIEGLLLESSVSYVHYFYINFLIKNHSWWPGFPLKKPKVNIKKALKKLELLNVKFFIARSDKVKNIFRKNKEIEIYRNKIFSVFLINQKSTIAAQIIGDIGNIKSNDFLEYSVYNLEKSLKELNTINPNSKESFISKKQQLTALTGKWSKDKQSYQISNIPIINGKEINILFKVPFFPNWKTNTKEKIELITPNLMLIRTKFKNLSIYFQVGLIEKLSFFISIISLFGVIYFYVREKRYFHSS